MQPYISSKDWCICFSSRVNIEYPVVNKLRVPPLFQYFSRLYAYYNLFRSLLVFKSQFSKQIECSTTFPLKNSVSGSLSQEGMNILQSKHQGVVSTPGYLGYFGYDLGMAWDTIITYTSKCVQMNLLQIPKISNFYSMCNKFEMQKISGGGNHPLVA